MPFHQLPRDRNGLRVFPFVLRDRIDPDALLVGFPEPPHPKLTRFLVPVLYRAPRLHDFIGRHRCVAHEHDFVVMGVLVHQVEGGGTLVETPDIVLPDALVDEIVKVEILEMLEFGPRGRE